MIEVSSSLHSHTRRYPSLSEPTQFVLKKSTEAEGKMRERAKVEGREWGGLIKTHAFA